MGTSPEYRLGFRHGRRDRLKYEVKNYNLTENTKDEYKIGYQAGVNMAIWEIWKKNKGITL